jgi:predicted  nucleic acid-binding Zn-ribbon protein
MVETIAGVNALKKRMKEMEDVVGEESPQENDVEDFSTKVDDDQEDLPLMVTKQVVLIC